jgi:hypothetical protein
MVGNEEERTSGSEKKARLRERFVLVEGAISRNVEVRRLFRLN